MSYVIALLPQGGIGLSEWSSSSKVDELMATISDPSPIIIAWHCHTHTELLMLNSIDEALAYSIVVDVVAHGRVVVDKSVGYSSGTADSLARTWQQHFHNLVKNWNYLVTAWGEYVFSLLFL